MMLLFTERKQANSALNISELLCLLLQQSQTVGGAVRQKNYPDVCDLFLSSCYSRQSLVKFKVLDRRDGVTGWATIRNDPVLFLSALFLLSLTLFPFAHFVYLSLFFFPHSAHWCN